jgi:hypothetical protein
VVIVAAIVSAEPLIYWSCSSEALSGVSAMKSL